MPPLPPRPARLLLGTGLALVLALTGCGGEQAADSPACAPAPAPAAAGAEGHDEVDRPVPKHDPRELDRMAPDQAAIVTLLRAVEQGRPAAAHEPAVPAAPAAPAALAEPCPPAAPPDSGH